MILFLLLNIIIINMTIIILNITIINIILLLLLNIIIINKTIIILSDRRRGSLVTENHALPPGRNLPWVTSGDHDDDGDHGVAVES